LETQKYPLLLNLTFTIKDRGFFEKNSENTSFTQKLVMKSKVMEPSESAPKSFPMNGHGTIRFLIQNSSGERHFLNFSQKT
jgi:hypothetical protein